MMPTVRLALVLCCLGFATGFLGGALAYPVPPAETSAARELHQTSTKCQTPGGICFVPALTIGAPCQCSNGQSGRIVP